VLLLSDVYAIRNHIQSVTACVVSKMGWWGVVWRVSLLVGAIAALFALPAFRSQGDAIVSLLSISPLHWFQDSGPSAGLHRVIRTADVKLFSHEDLRMYDGSDSNRGIYLAILGSVYDVSSGRKHYGPDGSYSFFSGLFSVYLIY